MGLTLFARSRAFYLTTKKFDFLYKVKTAEMLTNNILAHKECIAVLGSVASANSLYRILAIACILLNLLTTNFLPIFAHVF